MGDSADRRIACGIGMFERHFLGPIGHGEPAALDERKFASAFRLGAQRTWPRRDRKPRRVRRRIGVELELGRGRPRVAHKRLRPIRGH